MEGTPILQAQDGGNHSHSHSHSHPHPHGKPQGGRLSHTTEAKALAMTLARASAGTGAAVEMQTQGSSSASASARTSPSTSSAPRKASTPARGADEGAGGLRLAMSPAAARLAAQQKDGKAATPAPGPFPSPSPPPPTTGTPSSSSTTPKGLEGAAYAALRSGIGASQMVLHKPPETVERIQSVVADLAQTARSHINAARQVSSTLPPSAAAALLPAVPASRFLDRLAAQRYDVFSAGGLGPWQDGRAGAKLFLQLDLLRHTLRNSY